MTVPGIFRKIDQVVPGLIEERSRMFEERSQIIRIILAEKFGINVRNKFIKCSRMFTLFKEYLKKFIIYFRNVRREFVRLFAEMFGDCSWSIHVNI